MSADTASDLGHLLTAKGLHEFVASRAGMPEEEVARLCGAGAPWPIGGLPENPVVHEVLTSSQVSHLTTFVRHEPWSEDPSVPSDQGDERGRSVNLLPTIDRMLCEESNWPVPVSGGEGASPTTHEPRYLLTLSAHFERVASSTGVDVETVVTVAEGLLAYTLRVWDLVLDRWPSAEAGDDEA